VGKVLSAQGSGYFPSCIQPGSVPDSQWNLDLTIPQGMALYWRTKEWRFEASGSWTSDNRIGPQPVSGSGNIVKLNEITSEEQLVCLSDGNTIFGYFDTDQDRIDIEITFNVRSDTITFYNSYQSKTKVYPYFDINGLYIQSNNAREDQKVGILRFIFNGYTISKNLYTNDGDYPWTGTSGNVLIDIICREYWSYGGTYDTTTGEPL
jgi:hypothetical protein